MRSAPGIIVRVLSAIACGRARRCEGLVNRVSGEFAAGAIVNRPESQELSRARMKSCRGMLTSAHQYCTWREERSRLFSEVSPGPERLTCWNWGYGG